MKIILVLLLATLASANVDIQSLLENGMHPFSIQMVHKINSLNTTWTAKQHFTERDEENVKIKLGAILNHPIRVPEVDYSTHFDLSAEIPDEFDPIKQWPKCADIVNDIRDQANCGSCWAFAAVGAMSDRVCIASDGVQKVKISADDLISCCNMWSSFSFCGFGCNGGMIPLAWSYWVKKGIVSGGNYNDNETCRPYEIQPCGHHTDKNPCKGMSKTPKCKRQCVDGADYKKDKHYGQKYYSLKSVEQIQRDIMQHGSVEAGFTVYSDFPNYNDGVYQAHSSTPLGGHAVRIVGWGTENDTPYWMVANSWDRSWGINGFFKILRGSNHCGIEAQVVGGIPKL